MASIIKYGRPSGLTTEISLMALETGGLDWKMNMLDSEDVFPGCEAAALLSVLSYSVERVQFYEGLRPVVLWFTFYGFIYL